MGVLFLCHIHIDGDLALGQSHLHPAVSQHCEHQQSIWVPRPERQTDRQGVTVSLTGQPKEGCGVEEDGEGVGLGA